MPASMTITGTTGAGNVMTAQVFNNVVRYEVNPDAQILTIFFDDGSFRSIDISAATTFTTTISGQDFTVVVS